MATLGQLEGIVAKACGSQESNIMQLVNKMYKHRLEALLKVCDGAFTRSLFEGRQNLS